MRKQCAYKIKKTFIMISFLLNMQYIYSDLYNGVKKKMEFCKDPLKRFAI